MSNEIIEEIKKKFGREAGIKEDNSVIVNSSVLLKLCEFILQKGYDHLSLVTGVDYPEENVIEIVYHLYSYSTLDMVTLRTRVNRDNPHVPTLTPLYRSADWNERENYDMFGIIFDGHPNMRRIYMPETFTGYPLRKDYPLEGRQEVDMEEEFRLTEDIPGAPEASKESNLVHINMGPQHPSTHGVLRLRILVNGETIVKVYPVFGYLHRGLEKIAENLQYTQFIPYTDRMDYVSSMLNEMAYIKAVEELMNVQVPERADYLRVIVMELNRIASHLIWLGTWAMDLGAISPFFYTMRDREEILQIFENLCGARMTFNYLRFGGVSNDMDETIRKGVYDFLDALPGRLSEYDDLIAGNEIIHARTKGVGILSKEDATSLGVTGPMLRACGVKYDIRKAHPYSAYNNFKFDIPTQPSGDVYARLMVRMAEMFQSVRIVRQAMDNLPEGDIKAKVPKMVTPPKGEVYSRIESPKGELGFYIVSDGKPKPYRLKIRSPCFFNLGALAPMGEGAKIADLVSINASIDGVMGEVDK